MKCFLRSRGPSLSAGGAAVLLTTAALLLGACQQSSLTRAPTQVAPPRPTVEAQPPAPTPPAPEVQPPADILDDIAASAMVPTQPSSKRVALLLPLSGPFASVGQSMLNAAHLALFDFADNTFELVVNDTKGTPDGAAEAGRQAIVEGAGLILGPLLATEVEAVAPWARRAGVNMIAFSNDRLVAGDGVYVMGFLPEAQIARIVAYAASRGHSRFAVLAPENGYGIQVAESMRRAASAHGGQVTRVQYYNPRSPNFDATVRSLADFESRREQLTLQRRALAGLDDEASRRALSRLDHQQTFGNLPYDALLVAEGGKSLQEIAALLPYYDIDPAEIRMLGTVQWDSPATGAEPALVGGWFAAPPPASRVDFEKRYAAAFGEAPQRVSAMAYDATAMAAVFARPAEGSTFGSALIADPRGFLGRDGIFRFGANGLNERGYAVLQVEPRGSRVIAPTPDAFTAPIN